MIQLFSIFDTSISHFISKCTEVSKLTYFTKESLVIEPNDHRIQHVPLCLVLRSREQSHRISLQDEREISSRAWKANRRDNLSFLFSSSFRFRKGESIKELSRAANDERPNALLDFTWSKALRDLFARALQRAEIRREIKYVHRTHVITNT